MRIADEIAMQSATMDYLKDRAADSVAVQAQELAAFDEPAETPAAAFATATPSSHRRGLWAGGATLTIVAAAAWLFLGWTFPSNPAEARRAEPAKLPAPMPKLARLEPVTLDDPELPAASLRMQPLFTEPREAKN
jgi:hypothetical protein